MNHQMSLAIVLLLFLSVTLLGVYTYQVSQAYASAGRHPRAFLQAVNSAAAPQGARKDVVSPLEKKAGDMSAYEVYKLGQVYHYGRLGKDKDISLAMQYYQVSYKRGCVEAALGLARLYTEGDEATHFKPDGQKAVEMYMASIDHPSTRTQAVLEVAEVYANGLHPFYLPNKIVARQIYDIVLASSVFDEDAKVACRERLLHTFDHVDPDTENVDPGIEYKSLPTKIVFVLKQKFLPKRHQTPASAPPSSPPPAVGVSDYDIMHRAEPLRTLERVPEQQIFSKQNVHSSTLQNIAKRNLDTYELESGGMQTTFDESKREYIRVLKREADADSEAILRVLDTLSDNVHSKYDRSEQDVFRAVWSRIHQAEDQELKNNMIKSLSQSLASAVEHDHVVCSTGKITRILGSLDAIDPGTQTMRPEWAIEREIADAAAAIRQSYMERISPEARAAYEAPDPTREQKLLADEATAHMKQALLDKCEKDYVESGVLGKEQLDIKIQTYMSAL